MTPKAHKSRHRRYASKPSGDLGLQADSWENTVESLAMTLCPASEWQVYEQQLQYLAWKTNKRQNQVVVRVFPVWRKYRQKATRVATLYHVVPLLRHLPLGFVALLGDLLIK